MSDDVRLRLRALSIDLWRWIENEETPHWLAQEMTKQALAVDELLRDIP